MLNVVNKHIMLCVVMLSVVMLSVVMLSVVMQSGVMLSVVRMSVVMLSVVAHYRALDGSPYPGSKLVPSSLCKKFIIIKKCNNLYLGLVTPSSG